MSTQNPTGNELTLVRVYGAPRERVFQAWTDCALLAQWFGPRTFTVPTCESDPRPGGVLQLAMRGPDGTLYPMRGIWTEVVAPERTVTDTGAFEDEAGQPQLKVITTTTFEEVGGMTRVTMHAQVTRSTGPATGAVMGMEQGWSESLYKLGDLLDKL